MLVPRLRLDNLPSPLDHSYRSKLPGVLLAEYL
jgi:hypothetical protein